MELEPRPAGWTIRKKPCCVRRSPTAQWLIARDSKCTPRSLSRKMLARKDSRTGSARRSVSRWPIAVPNDGAAERTICILLVGERPRAQLLFRTTSLRYLTVVYCDAASGLGGLVWW